MRDMIRRLQYGVRRRVACGVWRVARGAHLRSVGVFVDV
jgi:hypothetical protein